MMCITTTRTKNGFLLIVEDGDGLSRTGHVQLVCGDRGQKLPAVFTACRCGYPHAGFTIRPEMWIVQTWWNKEGRSWQIGQLPKNLKDELFDNFRIEEKFIFDKGIWNEEPPAFLAGAMEAAKAKSNTFHARGPVYVIERPSRWS